MEWLSPCQLILLVTPAWGCQLGGCRTVAKGSFSTPLGTETEGKKSALGGRQSIFMHLTALMVMVSAR